MPTAFIVRVARTAAGKRNGALSHYHPAVLGAKVVDALVDCAAFDPSVVDDVIWGCVSQVTSIVDGRSGSSGVPTRPREERGVVDRCECEVEGPCTATDVLCSTTGSTT